MALSLPAIAGAVWLVAIGPGLTALVVLFVVVLIAALIAIFTPEVLPPRLKRFVAVLVALFGVVLGIVALPNILDKDQPPISPTATPTPPPLTKQERLAACRKAHNVPPSQEAGEGTHASCVWPAPEGVRDDGYCEIRVKYYDTGKSLADDEALVWTFDAKTAAYVTVEWWVAASGNEYLYKSMRYRSGQIVDMDGGFAALPSKLSDLEQNRGDALVTVVPGHTYPRTVTCA